MQDHRVLFALYGVFAMLLDFANGAKEEVECKDINKIHALEKCCNIPDEELLTEEDKAAGSMCDKTVYGDRTGPPTDEEQLELFECMDECFYNATHLLTEDMKLNKSALIAENDVLIINFPQWREPMIKATETCIKKNVVSEVKPEAKCKSGSYQFSKCFSLNLYLNCPQENWKIEDEGCNKAREILEKC